VDKGEIQERVLHGALHSEIAAYFIGWRHGFVESHSAANLMEYNWLKDSGAIAYDPTSRRFAIAPDKAAESMKRLSEEIVTLLRAADRDRAKAFKEELCRVHPEIKALIGRLRGVPAEIYPTFKL